MRITFLLPGYPWKPMGGFRVVYEYANHLVARNHKVTVIHTSSLPDWSLSPLTSLYGKLRRKIGQIKNRLKGLILKPSSVYWQSINKRVKMLYISRPVEKCIPNADVIFATWWPTANVISKYSSEKGYKFYLIMDFPPFMGSKFDIENTWRLPFTKVTISSWLYKMVVEACGRNDIFNIPLGIDHSKFRIIRDIIQRPKRIGMMYSTAAYKAVEDGLKALKICKKRYPELEVAMFGVVPRPKHLPTWIRYSANITDEELVQLYNSCSIFVSSSIAEGFAFPPAEAMACGCAIVATDSGGIREYAQHGKNALLSPPRNPKKLAENLLTVLSDDSLRIRLAKKGYKRIKKFTWNRSTSLLEKLLLKYV